MPQYPTIDAIRNALNMLAQRKYEAEQMAQEQQFRAGLLGLEDALATARQERQFALQSGLEQQRFVREGWRDRQGFLREQRIAELTPPDFKEYWQGTLMPGAKAPEGFSRETRERYAGVRAEPQGGDGDGPGKPPLTANQIMGLLQKAQTGLLDPNDPNVRMASLIFPEFESPSTNAPERIRALKEYGKATYPDLAGVFDAYQENPDYNFNPFGDIDTTGTLEQEVFGR